MVSEGLKRLALAGICGAVVIGSIGPAPAQAANVSDSYCSPSGDYCLSVYTKRGRIKLSVATFSFRGRYGLCVRPPKGNTTCRHFRLQRHGDIYKDKVDFARHFPHRRSGRYTAIWHKSGHRLRKPLHFKYVARS